MNWVSLFFIDAVCHQLPSSALKPVSEFSGSWSKFGYEHRKKRREFRFQCEFDAIGTQEVSYCLWETTSYNEVTVADLNLEFDRITSFALDSARPMRHVSLSEFERVVLPKVASLLTNCSWPYRAPMRSEQNRFFFNAFKNCPGFNEITVDQQGEESRDFIARQVRLGNVQRLTLLGTGKWPEAENLAETLKIFVSSARFHQLYSPDLLTDDYELFELFVERALAKELKPGARVSAPGRNLDESRLLALRPECRDYSEKNAWRIPDSNLRIALRYRANVLELKVEAE